MQGIDYDRYLRRWRGKDEILSDIGYSSGGVVYVIDHGNSSFYVGQTRDLFNRYGAYILEKIIYVEYVDDTDARLRREEELICEFLLQGLKLTNRAIPRECYYQGKFWVRQIDGREYSDAS